MCQRSHFFFIVAGLHSEGDRRITTIQTTSGWPATAFTHMKSQVTTVSVVAATVRLAMCVLPRPCCGDVSCMSKSVSGSVVAVSLSVPTARFVDLAKLWHVYIYLQHTLPAPERIRRQRSSFGRAQVVADYEME